MLFPGREYLLAAVHGGRKRQEPSSMEAGSERKMERSYADQHRCAGQQQGRRLQQPRKYVNLVACPEMSHLRCL